MLRSLIRAAGLLSVICAQAADFSSGSTGAFGPLNVTADRTVELPPDGKLHCTTVNVASGATLRFTRNALNTPVYVLATGDITVDGVIDVSGSRALNSGESQTLAGGVSGPGGFDGGKPGFSSDTPPGDGYGPGAGRGGQPNHNADGAGAASFGSVPRWGQAANNHGKVLYSSPLLIPLIGGSGGGGSAGNPGVGGGGGAGAILLASSSRITINGQVFARGGERYHHGGIDVVSAGSGGAIRLLAPVVRGSGRIDVLGGAGDTAAGHGRIRVDTMDRAELRFDFVPRELTTVGANMFVFPAKVPRLDITEAAGTSIPVNTATPVRVQLPFGSAPNRTVTVRAEDFGRKVPIAVVLTPETGSAVAVEAEIDNAAQNPASLAVPVTFPVNTTVTVHVWSR